ncbi:NUDIX hydrolase [Enterocloster clostridioformis]|uniref:NUDIX hydrolase n=1 Tax=Enterocloster clostridioformis TaxID=1531 RepID=A0A174JHM0_9FIRM|nr:NUDIX hydrolase [Enterocloster clostridioformis]ANU47988.1 hypothetical protein A4V08_21470 [Lachnoclostridium sp. YL32]NDO29711.1 NUDIX hydrolase [Enterocloster clostridioformis]OXE69296.1 NUDIX hydrolase [Enterocloster clostridioformis]QQR03114.1 NUDIX hydrolase [Enterocloster clostridioformis]CUO97128.1 NUDIX hydrolase [Enterocloster clostridioformis]
MNRKNSPYKVINSEVHNIGRVTVVKDTFLIDGTEYPYTYIINRDSVCIIPIIDDQVIVIEQYRHTLDKWMLEFPAGGIDDSESSEAAAKRELEEETGYISKELIYMGEYYMNQGISSAKCELFFAKCTEKRETHLEKTEFVRTKLIPISQFHELIYNNQFKLLIGIAGWYKAKYMRLV